MQSVRVRRLLLVKLCLERGRVDLKPSVGGDSPLVEGVFTRMLEGDEGVVVLEIWEGEL